MEKDLISTGQAAKLCSVTPDTILKWIKKNRIEAIKTAGGHYRIPREKLKPYLVEEENALAITQQQINYCWEYHSQNEELNESCRDCIIFASKAEKCFLMAGVENKDAYAQSFCESSCHECEYYEFLNTSVTNVLVITEDDLLKNSLKEDKKDNLTIKFSCCGYETSSMIQDYHPDYIIIDETLVKSNSDEICKHLLDDPRAHGSQIILAVSEKRKSAILPEGVCASIRVPFQSSEMVECFENLQKIFLGKIGLLKNTNNDAFGEQK